MERPEKLGWLQVITAPYLVDDEGLHFFESLIMG
jgi:hypothetical protein